MVVARRNAGVVAKDGLLFVVGGDDGVTNLASVEVYDPQRNSWSLLPGEMSIGRSYAGVAIVEKTWQWTVSCDIIIMILIITDTSLIFVTYFVV